MNIFRHSTTFHFHMRYISTLTDTLINRTALSRLQLIRNADISNKNTLVPCSFFPKNMVSVGRSNLTHVQIDIHMSRHKLDPDWTPMAFILLGYCKSKLYTYKPDSVIKLKMIIGFEMVPYYGDYLPGDYKKFCCSFITVPWAELHLHDMICKKWFPKVCILKVNKNFLNRRLMFIYIKTLYYNLSCLNLSIFWTL